MTRITRIAASVLTVAAVAPAVAGAAGAIELRGAPTLRQSGAQTADLQFAVDKKLPRKSSGSINARVVFSDGGTSSIASAGRHGKSFVYSSGVKAKSDIEVGRKYTVKIVIPGQKSLVRKVKLHAAR